MGENTNIEKKAQVLSENIFTAFGWRRSGVENQNFGCLFPETHKLGRKNKIEKPTHGTDAVFHYPDPYLGEEIYLQTELKSYARSSLTKGKVSGMLKKLGQAVQCANASPEWKDTYVETDVGYEVHGLLFVYNHTNDLDGDFKALTPTSIKEVPRGRRVYLFDPETILYLANVADDIQRLRGKGLLPQEPEPLDFFHPELDTGRVRGKQYGPATVETMLGPWLVLRAQTQIPKKEFKAYIYYRGLGESDEEMMYLLDYIFSCELLGDEGDIEIRLPSAAGKATLNFKAAKARYGAEFWAVEEGSKKHFEERLDRITCAFVTNTRPVFSEHDIGL